MPCRFLLVGLPRSGTTWLQTLLNSDPRILCRGEPFDAWQIDDNGKKTRDLPALIARDADPGAFLDAFLDTGHAATGVKVLFQHHPALLQRVIPDRPDLVLIHVTRENRLAQFASLRAAQLSGKWTATDGAPAAPHALEVDPRWTAEMTNELETRDFLLARYLDTLPHRRLTLRYAELAAPGTQARVTEALGLPPGPPMSTPLSKQGANVIADRFADPAPLRAYFEGTGRGHWLDAEI